MYGKRRIVLSNRIAAHTGKAMVYQKGSRGPDCGGSSANIGVWYQQNGRFYADLRSTDQEYLALSTRDLAIKGFGGCATKLELRNAIRNHRILTKAW